MAHQRMLDTGDRFGFNIDASFRHNIALAGDHFQLPAGDLIIVSTDPMPTQWSPDKPFKVSMNRVVQICPLLRQKIAIVTDQTPILVTDEASWDALFFFLCMVYNIIPSTILIKIKLDGIEIQKTLHFMEKYGCHSAKTRLVAAFNAADQWNFADLTFFAGMSLEDVGLVERGLRKAMDERWDGPHEYKEDCSHFEKTKLTEKIDAYLMYDPRGWDLELFNKMPPKFTIALLRAFMKHDLMNIDPLEKGPQVADEFKRLMS